MVNKDPEGRAATPEQKRAVIEALYSAWLARPEERLGQLLANTMHDCAGGIDIFYVEARPLASAVTRYVER